MKPGNDNPRERASARECTARMAGPTRGRTSDSKQVRASRRSVDDTFSSFRPVRGRHTAPPATATGRVHDACPLTILPSLSLTHAEPPTGSARTSAKPVFQAGLITIPSSFTPAGKRTNALDRRTSNRRDSQAEF